MQPNFIEYDTNYSYSGQLGAVWSKEKTVFRMWSPAANEVRVNIYNEGNDGERISVIPMLCINGLWEAEVQGDLSGKYYTYTVRIGFIERETIDIYARSAGVNGIRGMIFDPASTCPKGWEKSSPVKLEKYTDAIIYELHVRDFSADESGSFKFRGKFKAFTEKNVKNTAGDTIGLDYLADLGITHIHLLPVADYFTVDESDNKPQYNWGYDPLNYNIPEGSYSTDPYDGLVRVKEFKELILAAHKKGIGVVMDVVYNHTYLTMDSPFNKSFPGYYYRQTYDGYFSNGSGCGNEFASEREMARKFIIDSLCYLAQEYKLDGFRFDLMGLIDIDTLNMAAEKLKEINPSIILYGEGWTGGASPLEESRRAVKSNTYKLPDYAMFSDDFRDTVKGNVFSDQSKGYINGADQQLEWKMKSVLCAGVRHPQIHYGHNWTDSPCQVVNYVEAHDNLTFHDKLRLSMPTASMEDLIHIDKLGAALVFFSQGIPFIQAGQEFLRSKPVPHCGFDHNSYASPDSVNSLKWNRLTEFRQLADYYKGLIAVRKKFPELRMASGDDIRKFINFTDLGGGAFIARMRSVVLAVNPTWQDREIIATGYIYADGEQASDTPLRECDGRTVCKSRSILLVAEE